MGPLPLRKGALPFRGAKGPAGRAFSATGRWGNNLGIARGNTRRRENSLVTARPGGGARSLLPTIDDRARRRRAPRSEELFDYGDRGKPRPVSRSPGRGSWLDGCPSLVILLPSPQLAQHPVGPPLLPSPHDDPLLDPRVADSRPVLRCLGHFRRLLLATRLHDVPDHFSFEKRMLHAVTGGAG
jgi:hypothetical protein